MARPAAGSEDSIEVISPPDVVAGFFAAPGDCAVIRCEQPGRLAIKIIGQRASDALDASFTLEPLLGAAPRAEIPATNSDEPVSTELRLRGHLSRRGDIIAEAGVWLGGPNLPAAVEGLEILGRLPEGLQLEIQPLLATSPPRWLDWAQAGVFVGTRGRALPLAGLRFRLSGPEAEGFQIAAEALFLGSPIQARRGREIELLSAAGVDPLVGLRLELIPAAAVATAQQETGFPPARPAEAKVKVFRAAAGF